MLKVQLGALIVDKKTKARRALQKKVDALLPALRKHAEALSPRDGFVADIWTALYGDYEVEDMEQLYIHIVVRGKGNEASEFQRTLGNVFWNIVHKDDEVLHRTNLHVVTQGEESIWRSMPKVS